MATSDLKHYANLIKLHAQINAIGSFKHISDTQFLIQYNGYKNVFLMMEGRDNEAVSIGDWQSIEEKPTHVMIYYKTKPMIIKLPTEEVRKHLKKNKDGYVLELSNVKPYISKNKDCVEKFEFEKLSE